MRNLSLFFFSFSATEVQFLGTWKWAKTLHCVFSNESSTCLSARMHSHIGDICLVFLLLLNVSSNCLHHRMQSHTGCIYWTSLSTDQPPRCFRSGLPSHRATRNCGGTSGFTYWVMRRAVFRHILLLLPTSGAALKWETCSVHQGSAAINSASPKGVATAHLTASGSSSDYQHGQYEQILGSPIISSVRSSSVHHGLLHTYPAQHPLFQIFLWSNPA